MKIEVRTECKAVIECAKGSARAVTAAWDVGGDTVTLSQALGGSMLLSRSQFFDLVELAPRIGAQP